jgi:hypothetical protein
MSNTNSYSLPTTRYETLILCPDIESLDVCMIRDLRTVDTLFLSRKAWPPYLQFFDYCCSLLRRLIYGCTLFSAEAEFMNVQFR